MKELMQKIAEAVKNYDHAKVLLLELGGGYYDKEKTITYMMYNNAAGNHLFDDYPKRFGITKNEGSQVRAYFQQAMGDKAKDKIIDDLISWDVIKTEKPTTKEIKLFLDTLDELAQYEAKQRLIRGQAIYTDEESNKIRPTIMKVKRWLKQ